MAVVAMLLLGGLGAGLSTAGSSGDATVSKKKAKKFVLKQFKGKMNSRLVEANTETFINGEPFATSTLNMKR